MGRREYFLYAQTVFTNTSRMPVLCYGLKKFFLIVTMLYSHLNPTCHHMALYSPPASARKYVFSLASQHNVSPVPPLHRFSLSLALSK
jgi:hypothetical protein